MLDRTTRTLRISLMFAVGAVLAALDIAHLELRPRIQALSRERGEYRRASEQNETRAIKAERLAEELAQEAAAAKLQRNAALAAMEHVIAEKARMLIVLEEGRAELHSARQELARWNATGVTPDHVSTLASRNKALAAQLAELQANHDRLSREHASAKRTLNSIIDDPEVVPDLPPMYGSVLVVDPKWNFVVLDLGEASGLVKNGVLMINRDGKLIAKVRVRRVESERSIADILPGWRLAEVREGDQVMN